MYTYMYRYKISHVQEVSTIQQQLNNPVDNVSMEPNNAYSSSGPTYEQVANGNKQEHTNSILERDKSPDYCSTQLNAIESEGCEVVEGAGCDSMYSEASSDKVPNVCLWYWMCLWYRETQNPLHCTLSHVSVMWGSYTINKSTNHLQWTTSKTSPPLYNEN